MLELFKIFLIIPIGIIFWTIAICLIIYAIKENNNDR
jgi:hypothetical protein|nr:MAG TPA: Cytochrome oxidase maturation protein cbb3-type [Caudoviricetes sp.]